MDKRNSIGDNQPDSLPTPQQPPKEQLIEKKGEEYLREGANIEDLPNPDELDEISKKDTPKK